MADDGGNKLTTMKLARASIVGGVHYEAGDEVEVYEQEKRNYVFTGVAEGSFEEAQTPADALSETEQLIEEGEIEEHQPDRVEQRESDEGDTSPEEAEEQADNRW